MNVKFQWKGSVEDAEGLAIYTTSESTYEVWLPNFKKAQQLDSMLRDVFSEGRRMGHREMMHATSNAMNEVVKKL